MGIKTFPGAALKGLMELSFLLPDDEMLLDGMEDIRNAVDADELLKLLMARSSGNQVSQRSERRHCMALKERLGKKE